MYIYEITKATMKSFWSLAIVLFVGISLLLSASADTSKSQKKYHYHPENSNANFRAVRNGNTLPDQRPPYEQRTFHSAVIDNLIQELTPLFASSDVATIFANCLPNTLDTTVSYYTPDPSTVSHSALDSFVITGDIDALWLRDSMNQVIPYIPYATNDSDLQYLLEGLINRQANSVLIDPYANAFNFNASRDGHQSDSRKPPMTASVFEGKYEIDSLAAFLKLSYWYYYYVGDEALLRVADQNWLNAVQTLLTTVETMQNDNGQLANPPYLFQRLTTVATDTLAMSGRGPPNAVNGLTRSLFRPSDDAVTFPLNIPGNAMICVEINHLMTLLNKLQRLKADNQDLIATVFSSARKIGGGICGTLKAMVDSQSKLPYEIDGNGGQYFMDDANVPSLLSLPALGFLAANHTSYQKTREFVLSTHNPFYYSGVVANGIGGPHVGRNMVWPMSIILRAMTSTDIDEIKTCLELLINNTAGTGLMHESFNVDDSNDYTRSWFAWANGLFGELILQLIVTHPTLVLQNDQTVIDYAQKLVKTPIVVEAQQMALYQ